MNESLLIPFSFIFTNSMKRTIRALHPVDQSDTTFEKKQLLKIRQSLSKRLSCVLPLVEA